MTTELPRLELSSAELATWLDGQDEGLWWLVDGDPLLTGNVSFPCPGDILAEELRRLDRTLILVPPKDTPAGDRKLMSTDLDAFAQKEGNRQERIFAFRWAHPPQSEEWLLIEDKESAKWAGGLDDEEEPRR